MKIHRPRHALIFAALCAGLVLPTHPSQAAVDEDFMRDLEDTYKSLDSDISIKNAPAAIKEARTLAHHFNEVEAHYTQKGNAEDGVKLSRQSTQLSSAVAQAIEKQDFDAAADSTQQIGKACKSCHNIYKS